MEINNVNNNPNPLRHLKNYTHQNHNLKIMKKKALFIKH